MAIGGTHVYARDLGSPDAQRAAQLFSQFPQGPATARGPSLPQHAASGVPAQPLATAGPYPKPITLPLDQNAGTGAVVRAAPVT